MKTFLQFKEDIELISMERDTYPEKPRKAAQVHKDYGTKNYSSDRIVARKNHGEIHPGYELHQHSTEMTVGGRSPNGRAVRHKFTIVHKKSGNVAGEMHAWGGKLHPKMGIRVGHKGKGLQVSHLEMHPDHSSKKVGTSLPVAMYRHLHRKGHAIQSDKVQSHGGAHVWNTMRNDPELKKHMMIHDAGDADKRGKHSFQTRAHKRPESHIWSDAYERQGGEKEKVRPNYGSTEDFARTLILSGKKRKNKKKPVREDIELISDFPKVPETRPAAKLSDLHKRISQMGSRIKGKNHGEVHPGYDLYHHTYNKEGTGSGGKPLKGHRITIVHRESGDIAGEIHGTGGRLHPHRGHVDGHRGKGIRVTHLQVHPKHGAKKIGASLAVAAYRHLHKRGHSIQSDASQSHGGAHVWNTMRNDKELGKHMVVHDFGSKGGKGKHSFTKARGLPDEHIWTHEPGGERRSIGMKGKISASSTNQKVADRVLILTGKKRKKKQVSEDIEMAQILNKPRSGGLSPANFQKTMERKGLTPRRSGRIAKGYTMHTVVDKTDPNIEDHHIVHDATGHIAGQITTRKTKGTHEDEHQVIHTEVHGDHTHGKIGKSLAALGYKHLARKKGNLHSSSLQSPGGASVWNRIRKDRRMKGRVFHSVRGKPEVSAHDVPDKNIWATEVMGGIQKGKNTPAALPPSKHHEAEHSRVMGSRLVIRPLKKTK